MADEKPTLLVAKGVISRLGGAERDLLRRLPHLTNWFSVSVATLSSCEELEHLCEEHDINLYKPKTPGFHQILQYHRFLIVSIEPQNKHGKIADH